MLNAYFLISPLAMTICGMAAICITVAAAFTLVNACALGLKGRSVAAAVVCALAVFCVLQAIIDIIGMIEQNRSYIGLAVLAGDLPALAVAGILIALAGIEALLIRDIINKRRTMLTGDSIKESLDDLPDGICFSTKNGQVLLINAKMNDISGRLFGSVAMNVNECQGKLNRGQLMPGAHIISQEPSITVVAHEENVWEIHVRPLDIDQGQVVETLAFDVTDRYELSRELENNNRILTDVNKSLRDYSSQVHQLAREEEILAAKTKVHDDIGRSLLSFRAYLAQPVSERDRAELLRLWSHDIRVMKHEADPAPPKDEWELLQGAAEAVGVSIVLDGELPGPGRERSIIITALHECLTNTVRHAHGTRVTMEISQAGATDNREAGITEGSGTGAGSETGAGITTRITNDGEQPSGAIAETGGLGTLRIMVERAGGIMDIEYRPEFVLRITLPREDS
ncbi:hypothetical protein [Aminicella lysinilytica]|uniref:hypothetical protein n=1 Tax=Aminicella lysinilytica TaxID=433323 RepID=UPI0026EF496A|nr:hypothetical protein [Aminicella lysinilytica]